MQEKKSCVKINVNATGMAEDEKQVNHQDWEKFGEDIRRTIQDAVEYGNYDRLNQTITNTVNKATEWVNKAKYQNTNYQQYEQRSYRQAVYTPKKMPERYKSMTFPKVRSIFFMILGYITSALFVLFTLVGFIGTLAMGEVVSAVVYAVTMLIFMAGFVLLAYNGTSTLLRSGRFEKYIKEIGVAEFCNVTELAQQVNKPVAFVVKDLEKMSDKGWFQQGHLDRQKTCLIVTHQMYQQYKQLENERDSQQRKEQADAEKQAASRKGLSPEVQKVIEQGDAYVQKIRACNDAIPGEEISEKIYRIEVVVDKIFDRVEQNPENVSDIRKLMDYYLPTTVKLLEAYAQMDAQPVGGDNIQTAKKEIEATLDTLNVAFEKLLDSLFQEEAWDVSSDISVLNNMLAQEGLKEDGLKK